MGEISPASFADVTFALIQKISPRKLKRSDIPNETFHALREMVSNELSSVSSNFETTLSNDVPSNDHTSGTDSNKISFGLFDDEDSRMSGRESSEGSQSQYSVEDGLSKQALKGGIAGYSSSASSQSQLASPPKSLKQSTRARRLTELRASRRMAEETRDAHLFVCSEEDLPKVFEQWYNSLLDGGDQPVKCYHLVINSLTKFFITNTFGNTIEAMVYEFLRNHVIRSCADLNSQYEGSSADGERRLRELQLQILLEFHASYLDSSASPRLLDIVRKMRIVYFIASASKMRSFLEEQIADNFFHLIPRLVADVFDELCIQLPDDMEEYDSVWNKDEDLSFPLFQQKETNTTQLQQLDQLIEEIRAQDEEPTNGKNSAKTLKRKYMSVIEQIPTVDVSYSPPRSQRKSLRRRPTRTIPETPEEKLRAVVKNEVTEVVKATPMAKVCSNTRRRKSKLSDLVRISEERAKIPREATLASAMASKTVIQASHCTVTTSRDGLLGLHTSLPRTHKAKSNLLSKFTNISSNNSTKNNENGGKTSTRVLRSYIAVKNSQCKRMVEPKPTSCEPPEKRTHPCHIPMAPTSPSEIDEIVGKEQLERFRRRVEEINNIKDIDDNQIYYEQLTRRSSLFDEDIVNSTSDKSVQQNRTRRVITPSSAAHLAHTLLNVNNDTPLEVWKLPRNLLSPEKMPRMIRTGVSAVKMKKIQRMRDQCRTTSPTSSQQSEHSGEP